MGRVTVHHNCRRAFVDNRNEYKGWEPPRKSVRLSNDERTLIDWKTCCFICGKNGDKRYSTVIPVRTIPLRETLLKRCDERGGEWGEEVRQRLLTCNDLCAEEAIYHNKCMTKFRLKVSSSNKKGRPKNATMMDNFAKVCNWLEDKSDCETYTIAELHEKMVQLSEESPCYSRKTLQRKLIEHYGENIFFANAPGRANIICFKDYV